jgi:hypothetical protein
MVDSLIEKPVSLQVGKVCTFSVGSSMNWRWGRVVHALEVEVEGTHFVLDFVVEIVVEGDGTCTFD